jgi:Ca2+-transporting ATPase
VIILIVLINAVIGFLQQYNDEKSIQKLKNLLVRKVQVFRDNQLKEIDSKELVPGDIIRFSEGDKIMADCRVISSNQLEINEAVLTGESMPRIKIVKKLNLDLELSERDNMIYMGTSVVKGSGRAIVVSTGKDTEFGKIAELIQEIKIEQTPLEKKKQF